MLKVSIITPCFNSEKFIQETYLSVKAQTHEDWEWICVDDCSQDKTFEKLEEIRSQDGRVKIFQNASNRGAAVTRNIGLEKAKGEYIAFLDADDLWDQNKLETQINFMLDRDILFSYHDYYLIDQSGKTIKEQYTPTKMSSLKILRFNPFATSSVVIHRSIALEVRFKEHLRRRQDYLYWYECLKLSKIAKRVKLKLSSYRIDSGSSLSSDKKEMARLQWNLLRDEFKIGLLRRVYYFICYAIHGFKKYFLS